MQITKGKTAGSLCVRGLEEKVRDIRTKMEFLRDLERQVNEGKAELRGLAAQAIAGVPGHSGSGKVEFVDDRGGAIAVSVPDPDQAGNRVALSAVLQEAIAEENTAEFAGLIETVETCVLEGSWVAWMRTCIAQWEGGGLVSLIGINFRSVVRLSADGVRRLRLVGSEKAVSLLSGGIKAASVSVR